MKSIGQKARRYDEALKKLRTMRDAWNKLETDYSPKDVVKDIEYYFPELKESEDEDDKIKGAAIEFVRQNKSFNYRLGISKEEVIAWIEKQQGEHKPAEWGEEDEENLDYLIDFCNGYYNGNKPVLTESTARSLSNWLYQLKSCEIMPKTNKINNEEAEKTIHLACEFIRHRMESNGNIGGVDYAELIKRLKSLKDKVVPQTMQEWSEEDEDTIKFLISHFCVCHYNTSFQFTSNKLITHDELLEKIRHLRPQNRWKPSDLELDCLRLAVEKDGGTGLMGLYNKLCNLKGIGHGERQSKYME